MQIPVCPFPTTTKVCSLLTGSFTGGGAGSPMSNPYLLSNLSEIQPRRGRQLTRESDHCGDSCSERAPEKKQHVCMCMGSAANSSLWAESLLVTARPKEPQYRKMCAEGILKPW